MYVAARKLTVMGRVYEPGERIAISDVPARTLRLLLSLRRLAEVENEPASPKAVSAVVVEVPQVSRRRGRPKGSRNKSKAALVAAEG